MGKPSEARRGNKAYLPAQAQGRIAACGSPLRLARQSGAVEWVPFRCEHRFCTDCARRYSWRVASALRETFEDSDVYMLTLTQRLETGETAKQLEANWSEVADHWDRATSRARRHCRGVRQRRKHEADEVHASTAQARARARHWRQHWDAALAQADGEEAAAHAGTAALPYLSTAYSRTWSRSRGEYEAPDELTYMWVREVTRGDSGQWHVHIHVVCPDRATAEVLNAAWQATREQADLCHTDIKSPADVREELQESEGGDGAAELAEYVTKYVTGARDGAFAGEWSTAERAAYVRGMADKRVYDAAGAWRPIGLRHEADPDDPAVAVAWSDLDEWETFDEFWSDNSTVREVMTTAESNGRSCVPSEVMAGRTGDAPWIEGVRERILEQYRNISEDPSPSTLMEALQNGESEALSGSQPPVETDSRPTEALCGC